MNLGLASSLQPPQACPVSCTPLPGTQDPDTPQPSAHNFSELGPGSPRTLRGLRLQEEDGQAHDLGTQRLLVNIL